MIPEIDKETIDKLHDPDWNAGSKVHNWRNYIGEATKVIWDSLTTTQRHALYLDAEEMAMQEEWD